MLSKKSERLVRLVLDTNILVSAHIVKVGPSAAIFALFKKGKIEIYTSPFQLKEFERVLRYERIKIKYKLTDQKIKTTLSIFKKYARTIYPLKIDKIIHDDPDDDQILAISSEAKADYIVSGDSGLLKLKKHIGAAIISAQEACTIRRYTIK